MTESYVEAGARSVPNLIKDIQDGEVRVPRFQREFVWDLEKAAALIDSVLKGYPIGSVILWRTDETLRDVRGLGRLEFRKAVPGAQIDYVLDGQQRLTSLIAAIEAVQLDGKSKKHTDFSQIVVQLDRPTEDDPLCIHYVPDEAGVVTIPLRDLYSGGLSLAAKYDARYHAEIERLSNSLQTYQVPFVRLRNAGLSIATEVFTRLNTGGKSLTLFEIMAAKTYDPNANFDLVDKFEKVSEDLARAGFETIPSIDVLQVVALIVGNDCRRKTILDLNKGDFIAAWPEAITALFHAVDFVKSAIGVPVSKLLPYSSMIVPIAVFFHLSKGKNAGDRQSSLLIDLFWRIGWSARYSSSSETKLAQDKKSIRKILKGEKPRYDWSDEVVVDDVLDAGFSTSAAFSKTILCVLATAEPQHFEQVGPVNLRNDWLHRANSVNFHHVFPKKFLKGRYEGWEINRVLNIAFVDDHTNKHVIRAKKPSDYFSKFKDENKRFAKCMKSHLIASSPTAPIWDNDYDRFIQQRAKYVVERIQSFLVDK